MTKHTAKNRFETRASFDTGDGSAYYYRLAHLEELGIGTLARLPFSICDARVIGLFGDSITTDHISPTGNIAAATPAGRYLLERGIAKQDFNQYGTRRGNDHVMVRGMFANIRIKNLMMPGSDDPLPRPGADEHNSVLMSPILKSFDHSPKGKLPNAYL